MGVKLAGILREKHRLWIFENWVLKGIWIQGKGSGMSLEKILHRQELHNLGIFFTKLYKEDERGQACGMRDEKQNAFRVFVGKPDVKRPLRKSRYI